jgi:hypothetical protein
MSSKLSYRHPQVRDGMLRCHEYLFNNDVFVFVSWHGYLNSFCDIITTARWIEAAGFRSF